MSDEVPLNQLLANYRAQVEQLRAAIRDAEHRLFDVAAVLKEGAALVRRERERTPGHPRLQTGG